jgi:hypothetical protein
MKRTLTLTTAAALGLLAFVPGMASAAPTNTPAPAPTSAPTLVPTQPPVLVFHQKPVFNDYLQCFNGWVYTDFRDADGDESQMSVQLGVKRNGTWTYKTMTNSGPSAHGVFWSYELAAGGINPATVTRYAFRATDEDGLKSSWVYADSDCVLD